MPLGNESLIEVRTRRDYFCKKLILNELQKYAKINLDNIDNLTPMETRKGSQVA